LPALVYPSEIEVTIAAASSPATQVVPTEVVLLGSRGNPSSNQTWL
jgi:hypothetical protein